MSFPELPESVKDFLPYLAKHQEASVRELLGPYNQYENRLRELYAQSPEHQLVQDPHANVVPLYAGHEDTLKVRARDLGSGVENEKYIHQLKEGRKASGMPAMVESFSAFKKNFNLFSESSLSDLNWDNVVVAGSAVVNSLLPISKEHGESTRALRSYYHDELAPSSDVDLFIWGLDKEQAIEKIKQIEKAVKDSILAETSTIRTKNAITIVSQYPTRHVQIVLRLYKSVSEILTGFDVDSSCFAYDGSQVFGTPRGVVAFLTQCNVIDLTRRSPSYENRLFKYATRGFEVYFPELDRQRVDPTIYERSFARVQGLARLLVLERLPKEQDRDQYRNQRRAERARPPLDQNYNWRKGKLRDNFKDKDPQDVAEWVMEEQDDVSNYHTFTVPYGPRYNAKKIERLVYTKDLLLNAEWNNKGERTVHLHRHPCFVGEVEFIVSDCCTTCPVPETEEEKEVAAEESKKYVSGELDFLEDDPGRQTIGSFNPLTPEDWTDQAYLGNTESLCYGIVSGDVESVKEWCIAHRDKLDRRDHTGRTPLQLAVQVGSLEMVKILVEAGARLIARLTDGLTALHIACINGNADIINVLLEKSEENADIEAEKEDRKRTKPVEQRANSGTSRPKDSQEADRDDEEEDDDDEDDEDEDEDDDDLDAEFIHSDDDGDTDQLSMTQGSFVKIKSPGTINNEEATMEEESDDPDVYDVNILAWDAPVSPLHLAIICGHIEVIKLLVSKFGADVLLPVKLVHRYDSSPAGAILTLVLAAHTTEKSVELTKTLLDLGASPSQSDSNQFSALHTVALLGNVQALKIMMEKDLPKATTALNHIIINTNHWRHTTFTPLNSCIGVGDEEMVAELLKAGASPTIPFDAWAKAYVAAIPKSRRPAQHDKATITDKFAEVSQPVIDAAAYELPAVVELLLDAGVDINQINTDGLKLLTKNQTYYVYQPGLTLLDIVESKVATVLPKSQFIPSPEPPKLLSDHEYLHSYTKGTYQHWQIQNQYVLCDELLRDWQTLKNTNDEHQRKLLVRDKHTSPEAIDEARARREHYRRLKARLLKAGAKRFEELHPDVVPRGGRQRPNNSIEDVSEDKIPIPGTIQLINDFEVPSVHETNTERYVELYEAAWKGDKDKIRKLTTMPDANGEVLRIAVKDNMDISPLHIAIWRGEYDIAELMLEIANLQFIPQQDGDNPKRRFYIRGQDSGDYCSEFSRSDSDMEEFYVSSELVNQDFTIDDVANLAQQAGSKTSALDFLLWPGQFWMFASLPGSHSSGALGKSSYSQETAYLGSWTAKKTSIAFFQDHFKHRCGQDKVDILSFAIDTGDATLADMFLKYRKTYEPFSNKGHTKYWQSWTQASQSNYVFRALNLGHVNIASKLVLSSGVGMPIGSLAKEAGIQAAGTSKYYQGLLVRGKHKTDWAKEANKTSDPDGSDDSLRTSLLLQSVRSDSVAAVEWCLSDSPARLLKQWASGNQDEQVKKLAEADGGMDKFINDWLDTRRNLAIHMAVLSNKWESKNPSDRKAAAEILKYLIRVLPESLETKNITGHTPLALAMWTGRVEPASILIAAGADQSTRDYKGCNIVHLSVYKAKEWTKETLKTLDDSIALIDKRLIKSLLVERCSLGPTGMTPLATWLWKQTNQKDDPLLLEIFKTVLKYGDREVLAMVDGGGQMPIHACVKSSFVDLLEYLCEAYPDLVLLENGMGQTAGELCSSIYITEVTALDRNPAGKFANHVYLPLTKGFFKDPTAHSKPSAILQKAQSEVSNKKRILISSLQASEVAKRLANAERKATSPEYVSYRDRWRTFEKSHDEVQKWLKDNEYLFSHGD